MGRWDDAQWTGNELYQAIETISRGINKLVDLAARLRGFGTKLGVSTLVVAVSLSTIPADVALAGQVRALKIYHIHSREKATIVFKRNGRYDAAGLKKLNYILRDWRRNEPTRMDPRLFDLIWEVYQKSGSRDYIHVIGGYRSPSTNAMLRSRSRKSGVAEKSQHMLGKAMDFYIPDVSLSKLREIGMRAQVGGVGFYPKSGSPFVHMDVGGVRAWPRMSRRELARLFPDGKTLHRPAEGGQMPGYAAALADYKRRVGSDSIQVAGAPSNNSDDDVTSRRRGKNLLAALFSGGDEDEESMVAQESTQVAAADTSSRKRQKAEEPEKQILTAAAENQAKEDEIKFAAPVPKARPAYTGEDESLIKTALLGPRKSAAEEAMQAALKPQPEADLAAAKAAEEKAKAQAEQSEFVDLAAYRVPVPEMLGPRKRPGDAEDATLTAALDPDNAALLAKVPVPDFKPDLKPTIELAEADDIEIPAADVKPEEIAALAAEAAGAQEDRTTDTDEVAAIIDTLDDADKEEAPLAEMAALDVPAVSATRSFQLSKDVDIPADETSAKAIKGARPKAKQLQQDMAAQAATRTEPKLTKNLIAKWALTKGRAQIMAKPVKAPRFVSKTIRQQPTEVYTDGFQQTTVKIDPARFSGTAVNFMPVKKFSEAK